MKKTSYLFLNLFLMLPLCLPAQSVLPLDPAVRSGKLLNGFTYYIRHNEEPRHRVLLYLVNKAGSVLEDEDQRGLAHFMEHMSFNGTKHFPHNALVDYLQKSGIRFGADLNAYTSFDETVYQLPIPSDKPELLKGGIEIMRDWAQEATLDPTEIDKERGVVLEEKRLGKGAGERMQRQFWPMLLNNSRYAVRIPIGLDTVLDNFKRPQIYRFYHDWYRPDLQALIIVGDVNADSLVKVVKATFGDLKNPLHERPRPKYTVPLDGKNHFMAVTDKEMPSTEAEIIIKHPALPLKTAADYRKAIIRELYNQMLGERYAELSRKSDVPFIQGGAGISGFMGGLDVYSVSVVAKPGQLEQSLEAVWRMSEQTRRFGFTGTELERAKKTYLSGMEAAVQERNKTNSENFVREYQALFLKGEASPGISAEYELVKNDLPGISLTEVNALSAEYITNTNRDIFIKAPEKDKRILPDEQTVNAWLRNVENGKLEAYQDNVSKLPLLAIPPVAGHISSVQKSPAGTETILLRNGIKVILKPTTFKNDEILFNGFASGGTSLYSDADYQSAAAAASIIPAGGAGNYNADQLDKYLSGKEIRVSPYITERFEGIKGSSTNKDLETVLQLAYAYFTQPRKDTGIFNSILAKSKASLQNRESDPSSVFNDTVSAVLGNYSVRRTGPTMAKMDQIDLEKAYRIYKERFADASNFTFVFSGSIETTVLKPLLEKYLGSLPATHGAESAKDLDIHAPAGRIEKTVYKGTEPKATVLLDFSGPFDYNPQNKVAMDALKECLEIRLLQRLREDESGVYSPGVFASTGNLPQQRYSFFVQFGCAPQNVEKLIASTLDEIRKLRENGPPQENLDKWRLESKTERGTESQTNGFWLNYLAGQLQNNEPLDAAEHYNEMIDKVTTAAIKTLADEYLNGNNYIRLVLEPGK